MKRLSVLGWLFVIAYGALAVDIVTAWANRQPLSGLQTFAVVFAFLLCAMRWLDE